ncbi:MAG: hypothetical protein M1581_05550 [Candidatus Thermoplasmatota archaeon]|jgi:hypothetical protein|nr:hypothetical protein [Candidatus Thermoplasmatota archaeon]
MKKAVCFSHSNDQFETPNELMEWLDFGLRYTHRGYYRYRKAPGLGKLEPGSLVFFYKNKLLVGSAVVEKASRPLEKSEIERCDEIYGYDDGCAEMVNVVKFFPNSIWVWDEHDLVSEDEFKAITRKKLQYYVTIEPNDVLEIYQKVAEKRQEMENRA